VSASVHELRRFSGQISSWVVAAEALYGSMTTPAGIDVMWMQEQGVVNMRKTWSGSATHKYSTRTDETVRCRSLFGGSADL
jgi:hypothetical protein